MLHRGTVSGAHTRNAWVRSGFARADQISRDSPRSITMHGGRGCPEGPTCSLFAFNSTFLTCITTCLASLTRIAALIDSQLVDSTKVWSKTMTVETRQACVHVTGDACFSQGEFAPWGGTEPGRPLHCYSAVRTCSSRPQKLGVRCKT